MKHTYLKIQVIFIFFSLKTCLLPPELNFHSIQKNDFPGDQKTSDSSVEELYFKGKLSSA